MLVKKLLYITILVGLVVSCKSNNGEQTEVKDPYSKVKAEKQEETIHGFMENNQILIKH